jgi:cytoskeletal protein RodZ
MKQEDEGIRKLFQQLREEEERDAPSFAHDWNIALSRRNKPRRHWAAWRMAAVAAALTVVGAGWWMFFSQATKQQAAMERKGSDSSAQVATPTILVSQWQSPTEFLLRTPGEQFLKRVPRFDDSLLNINSTIPNQERLRKEI